MARRARLPAWPFFAAMSSATRPSLTDGLGSLSPAAAARASRAARARARRAAQAVQMHSSSRAAGAASTASCSWAVDAPCVGEAIHVRREGRQRGEGRLGRRRESRERRVAPRVEENDGPTRCQRGRSRGLWGEDQAATEKVTHRKETQGALCATKEELCCVQARGVTHDDGSST
jgi:hypothetical protein